MRKYDHFHLVSNRFYPVVFILFLSFIVGTSMPANAAGLSKDTITRQEIVFLPAYRLAEMIRTGRLTSAEVLEAYLEQIERVNPSLNAIVTLDAEGARSRAREADKAIKKGKVWGLLHGVPVTIKDNYATKGIKTTSSLPNLADYVPQHDSVVVARLKAAGAVILGKTNLPPLGMDIQTRSGLFGVTNNPWDINRTPGGSSGGEAAAVATGMSALGMGNDIGGSIRIPSHFCGVYGMKPTENFVSSHGVSPGMKGSKFRAIRHLSCCGPLARSIEDLRLGLSVIAGPDSRDPDIPWVDLTASPSKNINEIRIAWTDSFGGAPVSAETGKAIMAFTDMLAARGCTLKRMDKHIFNDHMKSISPEMSNLYGMKTENLGTIDFNEAWTTYGKLMDMEVGVYQPCFFRFINYVFGSSLRKEAPMLSMVYPLGYEKYLQILTARDFFVNAMDTYLSDKDVLLCPVSATPAFEHIKPWRHYGPYPVYKAPVIVDGKPVNYLVANLSYTSLFNLTGNPVVVIPIGYTKKGMPIGVQIVGRRWRDMDLLSIAEQLDKVASQYRKPDGY